MPSIYTDTLIDQKQRRLLTLGALFLLLYAVILTLSPSVRQRSWEVGYRWEHWLGYFVWLGMAILAHRLSAHWLPERDPYLLPVAALLSGWGTLTIWRLSAYFGLRQTIWLLAVFGVLIAGFRLPSHLGFLRRYKYIWLTGGLILTALTLLLGTNPAGGSLPQLWLGCCGIYLQPSEPLKLLLVVYLAAYFAGSGIWMNSSTKGLIASLTLASNRLLPQLIPTSIMTGLAMLLLLFQRDMGTAAIFLFLYTAIVYLATGSKRVILVSGLALILAGITGYFLFDVVRLRVEAWLNPWLDPSGRSYQIVQSLLAVANGGILGRGPGLGNPGLVPIPHSDFIFTSIAEESGLVGAIGLISLIALLTVRCLVISLRAQDKFRRYLAAGLTAYLASQSILIVGGNLRLLPLTGVTLPFVSYGGSSLMVSFLSLLLLLHISNRAYHSPSPMVDSRPYLNLGALLLAGLGVCALGAGWWAVYRGPTLLTRTDNARRAIADRHVSRGAILDRGNTPLARSSGEPGFYIRTITHPPLSPVLGYTSPVYGQSGLEASMDSYLRGLRGYPATILWWNHLLYGQPPPGLDIRTSLDLTLQSIADDMLDDHMGALVLVDAANGEILVMASHPTFDANNLEDLWAEVIQDPRSPLMNRAVMGYYPVGELDIFINPAGSSRQTLQAVPQIRLEEGDVSLLMEETLRLSPLQMVLAAAALSNKGICPAPVLVTAVNTPVSGWVLLPAMEEPVQFMPAETASRIANTLAVEQSSIWQRIALVEDGSGKTLTWFIGGTLPDWDGTPFVLAVLLEEKNHSLASEIGQKILSAVIHP